METAAPTIPSADLINYRFDQTDKKFEEVGRKLDALLLQNAHLVTEDRVRQMIDEALMPVQDTIKNYRWYWRATFSAVLVSAFSTTAVLIFRLRA